MDEHIVLLGLLLDDKKNEAAIFDIARDKYRPRIELQGGWSDHTCSKHFALVYSFFICFFFA